MSNIYMNNNILRTWLIAAHGMVITNELGHVNEIELPKNTIVIMPCFSDVTLFDCKIGANLHSIVSNTILPNISTFSDTTSISQYIETIYNAIGEYKNNFCIFVDNCPNIYIYANKEAAKQTFTYIGQVKPYKTFVNTRSVKESYLKDIINQLSKTRKRTSEFHVIIVHTCAVSPRLPTDFKFPKGIPMSVKTNSNNKIINKQVYDIFTTRMTEYFSK